MKCSWVTGSHKVNLLSSLLLGVVLCVNGQLQMPIDRKHYSPERTDLFTGDYIMLDMAKEFVHDVHDAFTMQEEYSLLALWYYTHG